MQHWEFGSLPRAWIEPLRQVDEIWVASQWVRQCFLDSGILAERVQVVPLGIDPAQFHPGATPLPLGTNRADLLEPALAARPGRIDQSLHQLLVEGGELTKSLLGFRVEKNPRGSEKEA